MLTGHPVQICLSYIVDHQLYFSYIKIKMALLHGRVNKYTNLMYKTQLYFVVTNTNMLLGDMALYYVLYMEIHGRNC